MVNRQIRPICVFDNSFLPLVVFTASLDLIYCQLPHSNTQWQYTHKSVDVNGQSNAHVPLPWQQKANYSESNKKQEVASFHAVCQVLWTQPCPLNFPFFITQILSMSLSLFNPRNVTIRINYHPSYPVLFFFFTEWEQACAAVLFGCNRVLYDHSVSKCLKLIHKIRPPSKPRPNRAKFKFFELLTKNIHHTSHLDSQPDRVMKTALNFCSV